VGVDGVPEAEDHRLKPVPLSDGFGEVTRPFTCAMQLRAADAEGEHNRLRGARPVATGDAVRRAAATRSEPRGDGGRSERSEIRGTRLSREGFFQGRSSNRACARILDTGSTGQVSFTLRVAAATARRGGVFNQGTIVFSVCGQKP